MYEIKFWKTDSLTDKILLSFQLIKDSKKLNMNFLIHVLYTAQQIGEGKQYVPLNTVTQAVYSMFILENAIKSHLTYGDPVRLWQETKKVC